MKLKTYVLYHGNCPDGFGAAVGAWMKLGAEAEYVPVSYGRAVPVMEEGSKVFVLDFSYPQEVLVNLAARMARVVVLDHHATAQEDLKGLVLRGDDSEIVFDMEKSGAVLAWGYFHDTPVPEFIAYLQDRDLWRFELDCSREVACAVRSYPMEFGLWANFVSHQDEVERLKSEGVACLRLTEQQVANMAGHHRWVWLEPKGRRIVFSEKLEVFPAGGWVLPVANATVFFSEVGERLLELQPMVDCAAYYTDRTDGKRQWGLRSRDGFDCSVIAKAFGGGGHKQAAGFVL